MSKSSRTNNNHVKHKPLKCSKLFITLDNEIGRASEHLLYHSEVSYLSHEQKLYKSSDISVDVSILFIKAKSINWWFFPEERKCLTWSVRFHSLF